MKGFNKDMKEMLSEQRGNLTNPSLGNPKRLHREGGTEARPQLFKN